MVSLPEQDVAGELMALAGYRFDLSAEIPIRAQIYSVGPEQHVVGIVLHHIAYDGWSLAPLVRDVGEAYASRCAGRAPEWAPLPVQYVDYTLWQRAQLGDLSRPRQRDRRRSCGTGRRRWPGCPSVLSLPTDRPYPPVRHYRGAEVAVRLARRLQQRVRRWPAQHNATSFMVIQAALAVLLPGSAPVPTWRWVPDRRAARPGAR